MSLPVELFVDGAPRRQRYHRVLHILFGSSINIEKLDTAAHNRYLKIAVEHLKAGISVSDIQHFFLCSVERKVPYARDRLFSREDEAAVAARAEAAIRVAEGTLHRLQSGYQEDEATQNTHLQAKRSRLEGADLGELQEELRAAEIFSDLRDHESMNKIFKHLLDMARTMHQVSPSTNKLQFVILQLEIIRRAVELWLGVGKLDVVRGLVGASTAALITEAAQCFFPAQGGGSSQVVAQQLAAEEMIVKLEEFILFFSIVRALCMFDNRNFSEFVRTFTPNGLRGAGWVPVAEDIITKRTASQVATSLDARLNTSGSLPVLSHLKNFVGEFITSPSHLGVMVLFCAILELPRTEALELITSMDIIQLLDDVPGVRALIEALQQARLVESIRMASSIISSFLGMDLFAHKHCDILLRHFRRVMVMWYANCFAHLKLNKASNRLSISRGEMDQVLETLISESALPARLDLVSNKLQRVERADTSVNDVSPESHMLLDCIYRSDRCSSEAEQSLRFLSLHRHFCS